MAKANIVLSDGTKVTIEGTKEEVAHLLDYYSGQRVETDAHGKPDTTRNKKKKERTGRTKRKEGPTSHVEDLVQENYFKTKRLVLDVQKKLEENGHIYPQADVALVLLRSVKTKKMLRRMKENKRWVYVNR